MNIARFIAGRYSKAKRKKNVIHLITRISIIGIAVSTASLVILLSAFNGIEQMVVNLYSDFDSSINIRSVHSKTFNQGFVDISKIKALKGVSNVSRALEEVVILRNRNKWVHAKMIGVDTTFIAMSKMKDHLVDGTPKLYDNGKPQAIFGAVLLDKLDGYVVQGDQDKSQITFNVPLREGKIRPGKNPINIKRVDVNARINYNREVNTGIVVVPYALAKNLLEYDDDITAYYVEAKKGVDKAKLKKQIQALVGKDFQVKTNVEKNELIFKTSKTERLIVYFILVFIFILASFNLIASITMLFIEKKNDISTLFNLGATKKTIFNIFFYEGLIIVFRGVIIGLLIGYIVTFSQIYFGFITMPSVPGQSFPIYVKWSDFILISLSVSLLGFAISYFPMKVLIKKHKRLQ